jgi:hypothetical protein
MIEKNFLRYTIYVTAALSVIIATIAGMCLGIRWAGGFIVGSLWSLLNFSLTIRIVDTILNVKLRKRLYVALFFKFPVLYLLGFYVLTSKMLSLTSLLSGVPMVFCALTAVNLWQKYIRHSPNSQIF